MLSSPPELLILVTHHSSLLSFLFTWGCEHGPCTTLMDHWEDGAFQILFIEHFLYVRNCSRPWGYLDKQEMLPGSLYCPIQYKGRRTRIKQVHCDIWLCQTLWRRIKADRYIVCVFHLVKTRSVWIGSVQTLLYWCYILVLCLFCLHDMVQKEVIQETFPGHTVNSFALASSGLHWPRPSNYLLGISFFWPLCKILQWRPD